MWKGTIICGDKEIFKGFKLDLFELRKKKRNS